MRNRARVTHALAALAAASALGGAEVATAKPAKQPIHHWVIEHKTMAGKVGRTEGWQRGKARRVLDGNPIGSWFPGCKFGARQEWRLRGSRLTICGRRGEWNVDRHPDIPVPGQMMNPADVGRQLRQSIARGAYEAAGEDIIGDRRVTAWREADRPGFGPEEERKLGLSTVYLDAEDGAFVASRDEDVRSGKVQEERVVVDEVLRATRARLVRAGLARGRKR